MKGQYLHNKSQRKQTFDKEAEKYHYTCQNRERSVCGESFLFKQ